MAQQNTSPVAAQIDTLDSGLAEGLQRRASASEQIYEALRRRIVALELVPGTALSRAEIADHYRVSQTPVRDAMMKLEEDGLLEIYPQSKTLVSRINIRHARETQFLRMALELEVARKLALLPDKSRLVTARRILRLQETALAEDADLERFSTLDRIFHQALCEVAEVSELWFLVTARSGHIDRLRKLNLPDPGKPASIMACHRAILAAIEACDLAATESAVREHLSGTLASADQIIARYPAYF